MNNISIPPVVKNLLIINGILFLATWVLEQKGINLSAYLGVGYFAAPDFRIWQVITYMFMHGGIAHIVFNMFALYSFGSTLEYTWGPKKFLKFYMITGVGALLMQWGVQAIELHNITGSIFNNGFVDINQLRTGMYNPSQLTESQASTIASIYFSKMVGASGAIFGLLIAFGMLYPNAELMIMFIPVPVKAKYIIPVYILMELFLGVAQFRGDSIAHFAHLGGALIGFILVKLWKTGKFYDYYE